MNFMVVVHPPFDSFKPFFKLGISPVAGSSPDDVYWVRLYSRFTRFTNIGIHTMCIGMHAQQAQDH